MRTLCAQQEWQLQDQRGQVKVSSEYSLEHLMEFSKLDVFVQNVTDGKLGNLKKDVT